MEGPLSGGRDDLRPRMEYRAQPRAIPDLDALTAEMEPHRRGPNAGPEASEEARERGEIGSSLAAEVTIAAPASIYEALASLGDDLRFVDDHVIGEAFGAAMRWRSRLHRARIRNARAVGTGAPMSVPTRPHPALCARCVANLFGGGEVRVFA